MNRLAVIIVALVLAGCLAAGPVEVGPIGPQPVQQQNALGVTYTPLPGDEATAPPADPTPGVGTPSSLTPFGTERPPTTTPQPRDDGTSPPDDAPPLTPAATLTAIRPVIYGFGVRPAEDRVFLAWDALGERAFICPLTAEGAVGCFDVPLTGEQYLDIRTDEQLNGFVGFELHVIAGGQEVIETVAIPMVPPGSYANP